MAVFCNYRNNRAIQAFQTGSISAAKTSCNAYALVNLCLSNVVASFHYFHGLFFCGNHRVCVWHCDYSSVSAGGTCVKSGIKVFFLGKAWVAKMHMHVDESWCKGFAVQVYEFKVAVFCLNAVFFQNRIDQPAYGFLCRKKALKNCPDFSLDAKDCT